MFMEVYIIWYQFDYLYYMLWYNTDMWLLSDIKCYSIQMGCIHITLVAVDWINEK